MNNIDETIPKPRGRRRKVSKVEDGLEDAPTPAKKEKSNRIKKSTKKETENEDSKENEVEFKEVPVKKGRTRKVSKVVEDHSKVVEEEKSIVETPSVKKPARG